MSYETETPNLGLPQWVYTDKPQMTDFNDAFSKIDTGVGGKLDADNYAHLATPLTTRSGSAISLTLAPPLMEYITGMQLFVNFNSAFTIGQYEQDPTYEPTTLNINGLGAKQLTDANGGTVYRTINAGPHPVLYDGEKFRVMDATTVVGENVYRDLIPVETHASAGFMTSIGSNSKPWDNVYTNNLYIRGSSMDDFVTEQGTSGIWTYRKWKSGVAELWGASGSLTASGSGVTLSLPFAIKNFNGVASPGYNTSSNLKTVYTVGLNGNNQTGSSSIKLWAVDPSTGGTPTYSIYAQMYITGTLV